MKHAALDDDGGVDLRRLARELERIADEVGDAIVDFRRLIIVRQDDRVALRLERVDRLDVRREERPFDRGNDGSDARVERGGLALDPGVPFERGHRQRAVSPRRRGGAAVRRRRGTAGRGLEGLQHRHCDLRIMLAILCS
jgi:hypothetical protein